MEGEEETGIKQAAAMAVNAGYGSPPSVGSSLPAKSDSATPIPLPSPGYRSGLLCAKALFLLSSLKSRQIEGQMEEVERLRMLVEDLNGELVRERLKCNKFRLYSMAETVLLVSTMLSFLTFCFAIANF